VEQQEDFEIELQPDETALTMEYQVAYADQPAQPPSGGDFHDAFPLNDGSGDVGFIIGDVAGHGPEQTVQAEHMRELFADLLSLGVTPAHTLEAVNALVEPDPHFDGFGTVFVGTLTAETGHLTYASGGHEPALIAKPDAKTSKVRELDGTGPPVGAFPPEMARFEERDDTVPEGGTLLLYTDGISDAHPPHTRREWFGIERLKLVLTRLASLPPGNLVSELLRRVAAFCRGRFDDDIAILAVRRSGTRKQNKSR
jgi:sigma-B regulation protein RsbU (phosphoserine phosphatase)